MWRVRSLLVVAAAALVVAACATARTQPAAAPAAGRPAAVELPEGRGREILLASCTSCHDLREVTKFRGFYTRAQWHDVVVTMVEYGAEVEPADVEALADYLERHLGRRPTASTP
jgi:cytochrome c5